MIITRIIVNFKLVNKTRNQEINDTSSDQPKQSTKGNHYKQICTDMPISFSLNFKIFKSCQMMSRRIRKKKKKKFSQISIHKINPKEKKRRK